MNLRRDSDLIGRAEVVLEENAWASASLPMPHAYAVQILAPRTDGIMVDFHKLRIYHDEMIIMCHVDHSAARHRVGGKPDPRRASIADHLVIQALQPLSILQIGVPGQLLDDCGDVAVRRIRSLDKALGALAQHEFDAIVLGADVVDAWPTAAYERIAELAGATPVVVQADFIEPMASIKQQQLRENDIVVATAKSSLLGRIVLTAILRNRALAQEPGTEIG